MTALEEKHIFTGKSKMPHRCFELNYIATLLEAYRIPADAKRIWFASVESDIPDFITYIGGSVGVVQNAQRTTLGN